MKTLGTRMIKFLVYILLSVFTLGFSFDAQSESISGEFQSGKGEFLRIDDSGKLYLLVSNSAPLNVRAIGILSLQGDTENKYYLTAHSSSRYLGTYLIFSSDYDNVTVHLTDRSKENNVESKLIYSRVKR